MAALRTPTSRIVFAIALSAIIHAAILWLPRLSPPHHEVHLPPLSARLVLLPKPDDHAAMKPEWVRASKPGGTVQPASHTADKLKEMEKSTAPRPFPKHLQLTFSVYRGTDFFKVGELRHRLDINRDQYTLQAIRKTAGLSSLLDSEQLLQTSHGKIGEHGLQPETFKEEQISDGKQQNLQATFDWTARQLRFSGGGETALPTDAQDVLSFIYQLSHLPLNREFFPLPISDGTRLEQVQIEIGTTQEISTPQGNLRALHLRKMHGQGEPYFELWLGLEYRLLPVKFRQVDGAGKIIEEYLIADIRAADEP